MTIPKHLMEAKICNKDTCEEIRTLKEELENLKRKERADKDLIPYYQYKNKNLRKENQRLNNDIKVLLKENEAKEKVIIKQDNVLNELEEDIPHLLDIINRNEKEIKVYQDEWLAVSSLKYKLNELKESDK